MRRPGECGQTLAEYAVVLMVIVVAIIATLGVLSGSVDQALSDVWAWIS